MEAAMDLLFNTSPRERIKEIVIDREGIKAVFETVNHSRGQ